MTLHFSASRAREDRSTEWLLDGDPAIRWQVLRDLQDAPQKRVERERRRTAREGWGARLLARQDENGIWAAGKSSDGGLYLPKWISTTYTMLLLRDFGLPPGNPQARKACAGLLDEGLREDGGVDYGLWAKWLHRGETCVSGMVLSILCYFEFEDKRMDTVLDYLLREQMPDGGWNCRRYQGATHSSVNTTISALEALWQYAQRYTRKRTLARAAAQGGREFLLAHRLFRSDRTGEIIKPAFTKFVFPPRWHYDVLRALDHFQAVDADYDERLSDAVELVRASRRPDGRWALEHRYRGKTYFELERLYAPSRWNTLRALRVLRWWERVSARRPADWP